MPLLIVGTFRSDEVGTTNHSPLERLIIRPGVHRLDLGRLDQVAVGAMVADMLALSPVPDGFVRYLTRKSEGNPFFVAEYLRTAVAEGVLDRDAAGHWRLAEPAAAGASDGGYDALPLPSSVRELVGRRLDGLSPAARLAAERCSVLGRELDERLLAAMGRTGMRRTLEAIRELLARQVLRESPGPGQASVLRFVHDQVREVAYQRIAAWRRRRLHQAAAKATTVRYGAGALDQLSALGHHYERAGAEARARECYLAAARHAVSRYAHDEAERLYRLYLGLVERPTRESLAARNELAKELHLDGRPDQAVPELELLLDQAQALGDRSVQPEGLRRLGQCLYDLGQVQEARSCYERSLAISQAIGDRPAEGLARRVLGIVCQNEGRIDEARGYYTEAIDLLRQSGARREMAMTLNTLALLHSSLGNLPEARRLFEETLALARVQGDRVGEGTRLTNLASLAVRQGCTEEADLLNEQALALNREVGNRYSEGVSLMNLASSRYQRSRLEEAIEILKQAVAVFRGVGRVHQEVTALNSLAGILCANGDPDGARVWLQQAMARTQGLAWREEAADTLRTMATLARAADGDNERAEALARQAESICREFGLRSLLGLCLCERAYVSMAQGRSGRALLDEARTLAESMEARAGGGLGAEVEDLKHAVEVFEAGRELLRGEAPDRLPEGLRRWIEQKSRSGSDTSR